MSPSNARNLQIFTTVSSIWAVVFGLIGPFYVVHVQKLTGGVEKLGIAFSIMVLLQALSTYLAGRFSDKMGRRPFLLVTAYIDSVILFMYTMVDETWQVYILQACLGATNGVAGTIKVSLLGDLTTKAKRGRNIGKFNATVSVFSAMGLSVGGYFVKLYGIEPLFYLASGVVALSASLLFFIEEKKEGVD